MDQQLANWIPSTNMLDDFLGGVSPTGYTKPLVQTKSINLAQSNSEAKIYIQIVSKTALALAFIPACSLAFGAECYAPVQSQISKIEYNETQSDIDFHLAELVGWINNSYEQLAVAKSADEISDLLNKINSNLDLGRFLVVDKFLLEVNYSKVSTLSMMSILRTTYQWRDELCNWQRSLNLAVNELTSRNVEVKKVLFGLL